MKIVHYPHPALKHPGAPVRGIDKDLRLKIGRMFELMYEAKGLGLAATQVALPCRLLVMNVTGDDKKREEEKVYINPVIVERKGIMDGEEGCLSFPGLFAPVKRARHVVVEAYDQVGNPVRLEAEGLTARAWQHEIDHLDGVVFIERFSPLLKLARKKDITRFEQRFRAAQAAGRIPPDAEIEQVLAALERELTS